MKGCCQEKGLHLYQHLGPMLELIISLKLHLILLANKMGQGQLLAIREMAWHLNSLLLHPR